MSHIASITPQAEVITQPWGHTVYGWTSELRNSSTRPTPLPLKNMISIHYFRWTAERARDRWLREHGQP